MQKISYALITLLVIFFIFALYSYNERVNEMTLYYAIGKLESDAGLCLTQKETKAIQESSLVDTYKNYLFELDYNNSACCETTEIIEKYPNPDYN
jgi:hypothetical protein